MNVFTSDFISKTGFQESEVPETRGKFCSKKDMSVEEYIIQCREYISKLDIHKDICLMGCIHECILIEVI